jgi:hypothetical protein
MPLEPKTQEVWCGVRRTTGLVSELRQEIDALRTELSGYSAYKDQLRTVGSFDELETALSQRAADTAAVGDDDVTQTVTLLRDTFADYNTYRGDQTSGALAQAAYDEYRSFLIDDNGVDPVPADEHIQLLNELFDPAAAFDSDRTVDDDWAALATRLEDNGVGTDTADRIVGLLESVYPAPAGFNLLVQQSDSYSAVDAGLQDAGLTGGEADEVVDALQTAYGDTLDSSARDAFSEFRSFAELRSYLRDSLGLSQDRVDSLIGKLKDEFGEDFDAVRKQLAAAESLEAFLADTDHNAESGDQDSGIGVKTFEDGGRDAAGREMPAGSVSIRAGSGGIVRLLRLSDDGATQQTSESQSSLSWSDIDASPARVDIGRESTISASVTSNSVLQAVVDAQLIVDGQTVDSTVVTLPVGVTRTVSFDYEFTTPGTREVQINQTDTVTVEVTERIGVI